MLRSLIELVEATRVCLCAVYHNVVSFLVSAVVDGFHPPSHLTGPEGNHQILAENWEKCHGHMEITGGSLRADSFVKNSGACVVQQIQGR